MKKTLFTLMLMLASVMTINAQSLTSNPWMAVSDELKDAVLMLSFEDDGTCVMVMAGEMVEEDAGMKMVISMAAKLPGSYILKGKDLTISFDKDKAEFNFDYDIQGVDEQTKKLIDAMIKPELEKQKPEMKKMLKDAPFFNGETFKVVSIDNEKLILTDSNGVENVFVAVPNE